MKNKIDRRSLLHIFSASIAGGYIPQAQTEQPHSSGNNEADKWILDWKNDSNSEKDLKGALDLRRFQDPMYVLLAPIRWQSTAPSAISPVTVPKGFVTDFASIPRVFWSLFRPDGNYAYAATLHDYMYWDQSRPKVVADEVFKLAMSDLKISDRQSEILFHAVDKFGNSAWENNATLKRRGEKRILSIFPEDPRTTWIEWKKKPGVFSE